MRKFHINHFFAEEPQKCGDLLIYQIGTLYCDEKTGYDTHMHKNFFELTAVTGGQGEVSANGNPIAVRSGDIFLSYPFDTHKIVSDPADPLRYHFLAFDTVNEPFRYQLERVTKEFTAPAERLFCDGEILSSLGRAVYELDGGEAFHTEYCSRLLDCVLIRLLRHYFPSGKDFHKPGREEMLVFSVMNYISTHLYSLTSLTELCREFNYEYSYLSKLFSATASRTLEDYYRHQRMETARALLHDGYRVSETAEALHYASVYSFSAAFRRQYGISPMQYKKGLASPLNPPAP